MSKFLLSTIIAIVEGIAQTRIVYFVKPNTGVAQMPNTIVIQIFGSAKPLDDSGIIQLQMKVIVQHSFATAIAHSYLLCSIDYSTVMQTSRFNAFLVSTLDAGLNKNSSTCMVAHYNRTVKI